MKTLKNRSIRRSLGFHYIIACLVLIISGESFAHGEKAQQAGLRMRTMNWFDTEISPRTVSVNEQVIITGKFMPSKHWPKHMASIEEMAFLNVGVPGPKFIRVSSHVNGTPMIRSTSFELGKLYEYEIVLKARSPGHYHVHPVMSIKGAGPIIGPAFWVDVTGNQADFVNTVTTLNGDTIDLETYGLSASIGLHAFWTVIALAWIAFWLRNMRTSPVIMPRFIAVQKLGKERADEIITTRESLVGMFTVAIIVTLIGISYLVTEHFVPRTIPLQTGWIPVEPMENPAENEKIKVKVGNATYRIPGRSFDVQLTITNNTPEPLRIGEFATANIRFINSDVLDIQPEDPDHLVASDSIEILGDSIQPGKTSVVNMVVEDALWETQRLTSLVYDPDSFFAGLIFLYDETGNRYYQEIAGIMIPSFI
ncbi:MAG: methane monooxygenase/ammonia monooxygenase subunit B [Pseudomonadales bacterium]|nr:methane monooxygenase/ammonia monooxygenase subunit B [Pseudomonadales bacterium]